MFYPLGKTQNNLRGVASIPPPPLFLYFRTEKSKRRQRDYLD